MKQLLTLLLVFLLTFLNVRLVQSQDSCSLELAEANTLLTEAQAAYDSGDLEAALRLVSEAEAVLRLKVEQCEKWAPDRAGNSRANPVPVGHRQFVDDGIASIEINSYTPEANDIVMEANMFNDEPTGDQRYILVELTYYCELDPAESCDYNGFRLHALGSRGVVYEEFASGFQYEAEVFGGGQITVQQAWLVGIEETGFQVFTDPFSSDRVFFAVE
jgi:hypothetical protein